MSEWVISTAIVAGALIVGYCIERSTDAIMIRKIKVERLETEAHAISTIASILISGTLANPKYHEEMEELKKEVWKYSYSEKVETDQERKEREKYLDCVCQDFKKGNVLSKGREPYIEQAWKIYDDIYREVKAKERL